MRIIIKPQRVLSADDAADYVGGPENFQRLKKAGWIVPLKGKPKGMDYDIKDLDVAIDRVKIEGWPAVESRKSVLETVDV